MNVAHPEKIESTGIIELVNGKNKLSINLQGAQILNLELKGTKILGGFMRADGKPGNTHPGTPILGKEKSTDYSLPQHGFGRTSLWQIEDQDNRRLVLSYPIISDKYPEGTKVKQIFFLGKDYFKLVTIHTNAGIKSAPVNFGEHFYWQTPEGWEHLKINDLPAVNFVKKNSVISIKPENVIEIPGLPKIILKQTGLPFATIWAADKDGKFDTQYVCIEPVEGDQTYADFFATSKALIHPGQSRQTEILISLAK